MRRSGTLLAILVLFGAGLAAWWWRAPESTPGSIPAGETRVTVEVLNATTIDGLARDVTRRLRRAGIDVVSFGAASGPELDSTRVLIRRGDSATGVRVREVLEVGRVVRDPDARLLLDVTVLLGRDAARAARRP